MTNVLIPTDFSPASLQVAEQTVRLLNRRIRIVLFHAFEIPFYYQDLIGRKHAPQYEFLTEAFRQRCRQLKADYPTLVHSLTINCLLGNTVAVFRNFVEANEIGLIIQPKGRPFRKISPDSFDPTKFFARAGVPVLEDFTVLTTSQGRIFGQTATLRHSRVK